MSASRPFAHLLNRKPAAKKADDETCENEKDEKDKAEEDKKPPADDKEDGKGKKGNKAEDKKEDKEEMSDDDENDVEDEEYNDEEKDEKKKDKAEHAERVELALSTGTVASARSRERARCKEIFASAHAAGRVEAAAQLAFSTRLTAKEAIGTLASLPAERKNRLADAMSSAPNPVGVGMDAPAAGAGGDETSAAAQRIIKAGQRRRGEITD